MKKPTILISSFGRRSLSALSLQQLAHLTRLYKQMISNGEQLTLNQRTKYLFGGKNHQKKYFSEENFKKYESSFHNLYTIFHYESEILPRGDWLLIWVRSSVILVSLKKNYVTSESTGKFLKPGYSRNFHDKSLIVAGYFHQLPVSYSRSKCF